MSRQTKYFPFKGGLNTEDPALSMATGELIDCVNYEPSIKGGYRRIDGFERVDGHPLASEATYHTIDFIGGANEPTVGDILEGDTSSATGSVLAVVVESGAWASNDAVGYLAVKVIVGEFEAEPLLVGATAIATGTDVEIRGASDDALDTTYLIAAIEYCRSTVAPLPGSGIVRGVWMYNGTTYAFRDNVAGTECVMYESSATGWSVVTTPTLQAGGRYEFINYNFKASTGSYKMYGVDGVNKGFEFDGTTYTEITTGMTLDAPQHLIAHKMHLFYSFAKGSVQHSATGDPSTWSVVVGAGEIGIGQECSGFVGVPGEALAIFGRNSTWILNGTISTDWVLNTLDNEAGAIEWTLQGFKYPAYLDDQGITNLQAVQAFGDFKANTLSSKVDRLVRQLKPTVVSSLRVRSKNQYRIFFEGGQGLIVLLEGSKVVGITQMNYGMPIRCTASVEDTDGQEILLFGSDNGYVYRMDSGTSFDGEEVNAWIRPMFNHFGSPENKKRYFKVTLEIEAGSSTSLAFVPEYEYGSSNFPSAIEGDLDVQGTSKAWDSLQTHWRDFYWDNQVVSTVDGYIDGTGRNLSLFIRSTATYDKPHTIQGAIVHYSVRGINR